MNLPLKAAQSWVFAIFEGEGFLPASSRSRSISSRYSAAAAAAAAAGGDQVGKGVENIVKV